MDKRLEVQHNISRIIIFISMTLKRIRYIFLLTAKTVLFSGCSEEQFMENEDGYSRDMTALTVITRAPGNTENGTSAEDDVQNLRLIVYEYNGTNYLAQKANVYNTAAEASAGNGTYHIRVEIPHGIAVRVFVVANEKAEWNLGVPSMNAGTLRNKVIDHIGEKATMDIQPPFVMFAETETIESSDYQVRQVSLIRTVAKVSLSVQAVFDQIAGLNGGEIAINNAELKRLPKTQKVAPGFIFDGDADQDLSNTDSESFMLTPTVDGANRVTGFTTEASKKLVFYLPEYNISDKAYYSFIQINGQYTPLGSSTSLPITYRIPLGNGVQQLYAGDSRPSIGQLSADDLTISRNNHYDFEATIQTLGEADGMLLHVKALPWTDGETIEAVSPGAPYLNVSNIEITLPDSNPKRIFFWTNQPQDVVGIMPNATDGSGTTVALDNLFDITVHFENTTQTNGTVEIKALQNTSSGNYTICLNAGGLRRYILIKYVQVTF